MTTSPRPPASTTPALASAGNCDGVRSSATAAARAAASTTASSPPALTCLAASAAARATVRMVPSTGTATAA